MIINSEPKNKATFGGITQVSEFKIRNSAKAFGILSSGLYANKIRAIIRELSCNALDSHVANGTPTVPFDLHLPTIFHPHFSVRDYGTGLSHDEVVNIYTTYFESTKADSNEFIGALGLGSKSPFSYTDNFTVIAIKDGIKGIYSAFINDNGVPSVAEMGTEKTDEPSGVEVKFAVTETNDFYKFEQEARSVFQYFPIKPNLTGAEVHVELIDYDRKDIIPGVHQRKARDSYRGHNGNNMAIMGNIGYKIDLPNTREQLGDLAFVNDAGLDIEFALGDVEFQASREGLQYTPETVKAIKDKYQEIADVLEVKVAEEIEQIDHMWDKVEKLYEMSRSQLWSGVVRYYLSANNVPYLDNVQYGQRPLVSLSVKEMAKEFNISLRSFTLDKSWGSSDIICREVKPDYSQTFSFAPNKTVRFIKNPENGRFWERSKYHARQNFKDNTHVFVMTAADTSKPVKFDEFFASIHNPFEDLILEIDDLDKKPTGARNTRVSLLSLKKRPYVTEVTWTEETDQLDDFDDNQTYYYIPLKGFEGRLKGADKKDPGIDVKKMYNLVRDCGIVDLEKIRLYGVRKQDLEAVQSRKNWVLVEDKIAEVFDNLSSDSFLGMVLSWVDSSLESMYYNKSLMSKLDKKSPLVKFHNKLPDEPVAGNRNLFDLAKFLNITVNIKDMENKAKEEIQELRNRYSMIKILHNRYVDETIFAEYINLVDTQKGVN